MKELEKNSKIEPLIRDLLCEIGEDPDREGLLRTPERVAKSWEFFSRGYRQELGDLINNAIFHEEAKDLVVVRDIEFFSLCEHHLLPFFGRALDVVVIKNSFPGIRMHPRKMLLLIFPAHLIICERF